MHSLSCLALLILSVALASPSWAYDLAAHRLITDRAVNSSSRFDAALRVLGFPSGKDQSFAGVKALERVAEGAALEDLPDPRVVHHFHNPLAPSWAEAGLDVGILRWFSSVIWQQHPAQATAPGINNGPGKWAWPDARERFHRALTLGTPAEREVAFADLFRTLGQTMHLVQDASVPAHARNDSHLTLKVGPVTLVRDPDGYEKRVDALAARPLDFGALLSTLPVVRPVDGIYGPVAISSRIDRTNAPVPVSALIDSGQYVGDNPGVTGTPADGSPVVGLAEYANANFFSKDTTALNEPSVLEKLPHPAPTSLDLGPPTPIGSSGEVRRYFSKMGAGDRVDFLAVPSALYEFLPDALKDKQIGLDDTVHAHYAQKLLPRAVGYSAALLDYFFRGGLGAVVTDGGLVIANGTPNETAQGEFRLLRDRPDGTREELTRWANLVIAPDSDSGVLSAPKLPGDTPADTRCWLIFRGRLGDEPDAVAASPTGCPMELPPPPSRWHLYSCLNFMNTIRYTYATQNPPLATDGGPIPFFGVEGSFPAVTCSYLTSVSTAEPPPNTVQEHPV